MSKSHELPSYHKEPRSSEVFESSYCVLVYSDYSELWLQYITGKLQSQLDHFSKTSFIVSISLVENGVASDKILVTAIGDNTFHGDIITSILEITESEAIELEFQKDNEEN